MESYNLDWDEYSDHLKDLMIKMIKTTEYSDVTLMCDGFQFKAHKSILSACSPELDKIIKQTSEKNPVIYLRGVHSKEIEALIEFMYLGRTRINAKDLPELLAVAQDLKIRGIGDKEHTRTPCEPKDNSDWLSNEDIMIVEKNENVPPQDSQTDKHDTMESDTLDENVDLDFDNEMFGLNDTTEVKNDNADQVKLENNDTNAETFDNTFEQCFPLEEAKTQLNTSEIKPQTNRRVGRPRNPDNEEKSLHECPECMKKFSQSGALKIHIDSIHNGIRYNCNFCEKSSTTKQNLKKHIATVHSNASL